MNELKSYLTKNGITVFDFSNAVGVTRQSVYKWQKGESMPTPCNIRAIHAAYPSLDIKSMICEIVDAILVHP
jgi:transcriptional regulator with XRE-family HTH domain